MYLIFSNNSHGTYILYFNTKKDINTAYWKQEKVYIGKLNIILTLKSQLLYISNKVNNY